MLYLTYSSQQLGIPPKKMLCKVVSVHTSRLKNQQQDWTYIALVSHFLMTWFIETSYYLLNGSVSAYGEGL